MKKSISFFVSIIMIICILITSASANEYDRQQEHQNVITDFHYIVYDKNGNVIDEGNIPGKNSRVIWEGITLDNGDTHLGKVLANFMAISIILPSLDTRKPVA